MQVLAQETFTTINNKHGTR